MQAKRELSGDARQVESQDRRSGTASASRARRAWSLAFWPALVFVTSFILYLALSRYLIVRLRLTGDEPWYLLFGYGLVHNRSIDLAPLFQDSHLYTQFDLTGPDGLHAADYQGNGELILYYLPGYALFSGLGYLLGGRLGVLGLQSLLAASLCLLLYRHASAFFCSRAAGVFAWLAFLFALPPLVFVGQIFPSTTASFLAFGGFLLLTRLAKPTSLQRLLPVATLLGLIAATLPWLHTKYLLLAVTLVAMALLCLRPWRAFRQNAADRRRVWLASASVTALPLFSLALIALYSQRAFGSWTPKYSVTASDAASLPNLDVARGLALYADMFFGSQSGLFVWAPVYLLAVLGFFLLARRDRLQAAFLLGCVLGLLGAFVSAFVTPAVSQAYALPARFCVECAPFFAFCAAAVFAPAWASFRQSLAMRGKNIRHTALADRRRTWAGVTVLAATILLLATSAWFTLLGLRAPDYLYPTAAGNRVALRFAKIAPGWWFDLFPDVTSTVKHSGAVSLTREPTPSGDTQASQVSWSNAATLAYIPPGRYVATYSITCDATGASASSATLTLRAERIAAPTHTSVGQRQASLPSCISGRPAQLTLPFSSDGYEAVEFVVIQPQTTAITSLQVSYHPA
jgi:hypothetical protein